MLPKPSDSIMVFIRVARTEAAAAAEVATASAIAATAPGSLLYLPAADASQPLKAALARSSEPQHYNMEKRANVPQDGGYSGSVK